MKKRLTKSKSNVVVSGVLGGIGEYIGIDPTILRVVYILLALFTAGFPGFMLYIILLMAMPSGNSNASNYSYGRDQNKTYQNYHGYETNNNKTCKKPKEAEKVEDDDWSDF